MIGAKHFSEPSLKTLFYRLVSIISSCITHYKSIVSCLVFVLNVAAVHLELPGSQLIRALRPVECSD